MNRTRKSMAAILVTGGAVGAWFGGNVLVRNYAFAQQEHQVQTTREELKTVNDLSTAFRNVDKVLEPSVVQIQVRKTIKGAAAGQLPFDDNMLRKFFRGAVPPGGQQAPNPGKGDENGPDDEAAPGDPAAPPDGFEQVGTGSGVIMEVDGSTGYILTNNHVAGGASEIVVTLSNGTRIENAKLVGADPKSDLAVVKIHADHLIPAKWGDSSTLQKGDWILAFGSPFGYVGSMTHGIISALDRSDVGILGRQGYEDFIQVDAPINPGNSGGPLVDLHGNVMGINTAIASRSGAFSGIGFAIPSNEAKFVYSALKSQGKVTRGWLGVGIVDVNRDPNLAKSFGYKGDGGVLVQETFANTPASGKLQNGDIITQIDGKPVSNTVQLRNVIAATPPNTDLQMNVFRNGKEEPVTVKLGEQPLDLTAMEGARGPARNGGAGATAYSQAMGMTLANPTDEQAQKFNLGENSKGALVLRVQPKSAAERAGLRPGDLISRVGNAVVHNATEASQALNKPNAKKGVRLYITSPEGSRFVFIEPHKSQQ
ncbi:MAG TPA: trypsin-like peptidase domain-containing protein [Tepidisphaeraceae bacterium]|nr:trypsin-like peptidase domain-containing protein [Tepidisphaeraceae bacterium]